MAIKEKDLAYYEAEITKKYIQLHADPGNKKIKEDIKKLANGWFNFIDIEIQVASNEQKPLSKSSLQHNVVPMALKEVTGFDQTGDYIFIIKTYSSPDAPCYGGIIYERKGTGDAYGTFFTGRERFYDEIDRFQKLPWAKHFFILIEGTENDYLNYVPFRKYCKFCSKTSTTINKEGKSVITCTAKPTPRVVRSTSSCFAFKDYQDKATRIKESLNSKKATLHSLVVRDGVKIVWCGSRENMSEYIVGTIQKWCIANCTKIIGLGDL